MTSEGSPSARFQRAINNGSLILALAAAHDLPFVSLPDSLRLVVLMAAERDKLRDPSMVRWLGRLCLEAKGLSLLEVLDAGERLEAIAQGLQVAEHASALEALCAGRA